MIYTTGYARQNAEDLKALAEHLNAVVCDIRLVPRSRWAPQWNKSSLVALLGPAYRHVKQLGNKTFRELTINILDLNRGIEIVEGLAQSYAVILMCGCANYCDCHRKPVGEAFSARGHEVRELASWGIEPLLANPASKSTCIV